MEYFITSVSHDGENTTFVRNITLHSDEDINVMDACKGAVREYLLTEEGWEYYLCNNKHFGLTDLGEIPDEICERHGFRITENRVPDLIDFDRSIAPEEKCASDTAETTVGELPEWFATFINEEFGSREIPPGNYVIRYINSRTFSPEYADCETTHRLTHMKTETPGIEAVFAFWSRYAGQNDINVRNIIGFEPAKEKQGLYSIRCYKRNGVLDHTESFATLDEAVARRREWGLSIGLDPEPSVRHFAQYPTVWKGEERVPGY